jgi:hypothetical protein
VISGHDQDDDEAAARAMETAFERINEVGAFSTSRGDDGALEIDATPFMGAVIVPMRYLIRQIELYSGASWDEVLVAFRDWVDENLVDDEA